MNEREIFTEAMQKLTPAERASFLDEACGDDTALRQRIEALISAQDELGSFLETSATGVDVGLARTIEHIPAEQPGSQIGPYKLLQAIGEGGMGVVYMAEQLTPLVRRVALKIIKPGMDTRQVIARFEAERQALAMMDHPSIAKVLDAGATASGRPYFVMELVKGVPITQYCDRQHLTPKQRLELFIPVCRAVQHAHQKGIIHRDLKPSNVLIALYDGHPVPKVIDFGVAKATNQRLTEKTMYTEVGSIVGTLEYMAPEQAELNNLDIDTRADVYSLGVILYELLTGSPPFSSRQLRNAAFDEMLRIIREEEPAKPSTKISRSNELATIAANRHLEPQRLTRLVQGDLDWIVLKCLEKQRERRYETANGLALEIERYLADEPVLAGPPSAAYQLRKYMRRHRGLVTAAGIVLLVVLLGAIGTTAGLMRAAWERSAKETANQNASASDRLAKAAFEAEGEARTAEKKATGLLLRAQQAEREVQIREHLSKARSYRLSRRPGQRFECLEQVAAAVRLDPTVKLRDELRDEAIAALCLPDLRPAKTLPAADMAFDAQFERYASRTDTKSAIVVRQLADNRELLTIPASAETFWYEFRLTPDGQMLLCGPIDQRKVALGSRSWDLATRREGPRYLGQMVAISADSKWVITWDSTADGEVRRYEVATGRQVGGARVGPGRKRFVLLPDGKSLSVSGQDLTVWNLDDGSEQPRTGRDQILWEHNWDSTGRFLFGRRRSDGNYFLWDDRLLQTQALFDPVGAAPHDSMDKFLDHLVFSPRGDLIAANGTHIEMLRLWDPATGKELLGLETQSTPLSFSSDGRLLGYTKRGSEIFIWEVASASEFCRPLAIPFYTTNSFAQKYAWTTSSKIAWSPDGRLLTATTSSGVRLWDAQSGEPLATLPISNEVYYPCFDPVDGSFLVPGAEGLTRWPFGWSNNLRGAGSHLTIDLPHLTGLRERFNGISVANRMRRGLLWHSLRLNTSLIDLDSLAVVGKLDVRTFFSPTISPDGLWIAAGPLNYANTTTKIYDGKSGELARELPLDQVGTGNVVVEFSDDSKWLATSAPGGLCLWSTENWEPVPLTKREGSMWPGAIAFAPKQSLLAYARSPTQIALIEPESGRFMSHLTLPYAVQVADLEFGPDGMRLAVMTDTRPIFIFDLRRIRAALEEMGLDWDQRPLPMPVVAPAGPLDVTVLLAKLNALKVRLRQLEGSKKYQEALADCLAGLQEFPDHPELLSQAALLYSQLAQKDKAVEQARKLLTVASQDLGTEAVDAYVKLAEAWFDRSDMEQEKLALELAERLAALFPNNWHARNCLGRVYYQMKRWDDAAREFQASVRDAPITYHPQQVQALLYLAITEHHRGNRAKAEGYLEQTKKWKKENHDTYRTWTPYHSTIEAQQQEVEQLLKQSPNGGK